MLNILKTRPMSRAALTLISGFILASCSSGGEGRIVIPQSDEPGSAEIADAGQTLLDATEGLPDAFVNSVSAAIEQVPSISELMPDGLNAICLSPERIAQTEQDVQRFYSVAQDRIVATVNRSEDCAAGGESCPDYGPEAAALRVLNAHIAQASANVKAFSDGDKGPEARAALRGMTAYAIDSWAEWISAHNTPDDWPSYSMELYAIADSITDGADIADIELRVDGERRLLQQASLSVGATASIFVGGAANADQGDSILSSEAYATRLGERTGQLLRHVREAEAALITEAQAGLACESLTPQLAKANASRAKLEQVISVCQADRGCVVNSANLTNAEEEVDIDRAAAVSSAFELLEGL